MKSQSPVKDSKLLVSSFKLVSFSTGKDMPHYSLCQIRLNFLISSLHLISHVSLFWASQTFGLIWAFVICFDAEKEQVMLVVVSFCTKDLSQTVKTQRSLFHDYTAGNVLFIHTNFEQNSIPEDSSMKAKLTFRGWKSYFTQCWKPFPFDLRDVMIKQLPTKCAEYPMPLLVRKLKTNKTTHNLLKYKFLISKTLKHKNF